jgi:hypothetical protein
MLMQARRLTAAIADNVGKKPYDYDVNLNVWKPDSLCVIHLARKKRRSWLLVT